MTNASPSLVLQFRAAAVIFEADWVLLHRMEGESIWALPGGRIHSGEAAASAVARELLEETGERVQVGELLYVVENFFSANRTSYHEVGLYFRATLARDSRLADTSRSHAGTEGGKRLEYRWFRRSVLGDVEIRPPFLREALAKGELAFEHAVQRDENPFQPR